MPRRQIIALLACNPINGEQIVDALDNFCGFLMKSITVPA
jgi:hypothetical protein